jgi:hypothetical protein
MDHMLIAQQDLLHKADQIRIKLINDAARNRPLRRDDQLTVGQLVLVPWNDKNQRPSRFAGNFMGPYVIVRTEEASGTVALAHSIVPTPPFEPATYISAVSELRLYDDTLAISDYDIPEDRFRQHAYSDRLIRPVNCILNFRPLAQPVSEPANHVSNFEYEVRFENAKTPITSWLPYSSIYHTFAFEAFYNCMSRSITGHQCVAIPSSHRHTQQSRASAAGQRRRQLSRQAASVANFDANSMSFHTPQ